MQDEAYKRFAAQFEAGLQGDREAAREAFKAPDRKVRDLDKKHAGLLAAVEDGDDSAPIIKRLNEVDAELAALRDLRDGLVPEPVELPPDLPALSRRYVDDLSSTLMDEEVSGSAADELDGLMDRAVDQGPHDLDVSGKLLEMLANAKPADAAGYVSNDLFARTGCGSRI